MQGESDFFSDGYGFCEGAYLVPRTVTAHLPLTCAECGHILPPKDPTDAEVDAFLDDDSTRGCETCSRLWLKLVVRMLRQVAV